MKQFLQIFFGVFAAILVSGLVIWLSFSHNVQTEGERSLAIAQRFWHQTACGGSIAVTRGNLPGEEGGQASYDVVTLPTGTKLVQNCRITIDSRSFSQVTYCAIMVHEYGHLLGHRHSRNPRSVMYPRISNRNIPRSCK